MDDEKYELVKLWVKSDNGEYVNKVVKVPKIEYRFSEHEVNKLKEFWRGMSGIDRLTESFIRELRYYMDTMPKLITDNNTKIETVESDSYKKVEKSCEKLITMLSKIPDVDRINLLSLHERRQEYNGKLRPMCDPLDYVVAIQKLAEKHSYELKKCVKYERQWNGLKDYIKRFPPCNNITDKQFSDLFSILYDVDSESLRKTKNKFSNTSRKK